MEELYNMAGHLFRRMNQISTSVFAEKMKEIGSDLTPVQYSALAALSANPHVDQATLAGLIAHDRVTMGAVLDRLQNKGFVERTVSQRDRRARVLTLTSQGQELLNTVTPIVRALQDEILGGLDDAEKSQLLSLLRKAADTGNDRSRAPLLAPQVR